MQRLCTDRLCPAFKEWGGLPDRRPSHTIQFGYWLHRPGIPASSTGMSEHDDKTVAPSGAILRVNMQKSADAIVVRRRESTGEGLNNGTERRPAHLQTEASESPDSV